MYTAITITRGETISLLESSYKECYQFLQRRRRQGIHFGDPVARVAILPMDMESAERLMWAHKVVWEVWE